MPVARIPNPAPVELPMQETAIDVKAAYLAQVDEFCASAKSTGADHAECDAHAASLKQQIEDGKLPPLYSGWPEKESE